MDARLLGWAGLQLRDGSSSVVIDPLEDPAALWAWAGDRGRAVALPEIVAAEPGGAISVALVTHMHRDHADAGALKAALSPDGVVLAPEPFGGDDVEEAGIAQAGAEIANAGLPLRRVRAWERIEIDGWVITALPAVDGLGDPQVSWLVQRTEGTVLHCGDTMMHGWWWRFARRATPGVDVAFLPINAARVRFPHRRPASPLPAAMGGREAAVAATSVGARRLVPIHFGAFDAPSLYVSDADALATLRAEASELGMPVDVPRLGAWFDVAAPTG